MHGGLGYVVELPGLREGHDAAEGVEVVEFDGRTGILGLLNGGTGGLGVTDQGVRAGGETGQPDAGRATDVARRALAEEGVVGRLGGASGPVGDERLQGTDPGAHGLVVSVVGTHEGRTGLHHRGARVAQVVAGLGEHAGRDPGEKVQLTGLQGLDPAVFEQPEGEVLHLDQVAEQRRQRQPRVRGGEPPHFVMDLAQGLRADAAALCHRGEPKRTTSRHRELPFQFRCARVEAGLAAERAADRQRRCLLGREKDRGRP
ncbi:hypothetical protein [Streptomyces sp. NPDC008125]|uniref:hypothetical protein n=1 Tax=Streptomyces sp. NPDC008125 TaxID=3364811 RepID=UPI0036E4C09F